MATKHGPTDEDGITHVSSPSSMSSRYIITKLSGIGCPFWLPLWSLDVSIGFFPWLPLGLNDGHYHIVDEKMERHKELRHQI